MEVKDLKVLLVEDDANSRATVEAMLQEMGIVHILKANNGTAALEYLADERVFVNLIICDWNMPKKTGFELLREVRQTHPDVPFIMITARADKNSILDAKVAHVTGYLRKPFSYDELRAKISTIITRL